MKQYTIYCTPEQTKKALELGAPIKLGMIKKLYDKFRPFVDIDGCFEAFYSDCYCEDDKAYINPTAEQMIGWLEEQDIIKEIEIGIYEDDKWTYMVHLKSNPAIVNHTLYNSRKEATLAAIDAALEYLLEQNK